MGMTEIEKKKAAENSSDPVDRSVYSGRTWRYDAGFTQE